MQASVTKYCVGLVVGFALGSTTLPLVSQTPTPTQSPSVAAPSSPPVTYIEIAYMKLAKGRGQEWLDLEQKYWKPMHEQRIKDGTLLSWMAVAPRFGGAADYDVATFNVYPSLKAADDVDYASLAKRVHHTDDFAQRTTATENVRTIVRSDLFAVLDQTR